MSRSEQTNAPPPLGDARTTDVFVSYARVDEPFVQKLNDALITHGKQVWVDRKNILPTAEWLQEIRNGINSAHTFLFVISPASVSSEMCCTELSVAVELKKRLISVVCIEITNDRLPAPLKAIQWIDLHAGDFSDQSLQPLLSVVEKDLDWLRQNIRWDLRAKEWQQNGYDPGFLLSGVELEQAQQWKDKGATDVLHPSQIQKDYINASVRASAERLSSDLAEQALRNVKGCQDLALLLSVEAVRSAPTAAAERSLLAALDGHPHVYAWLRTQDGGLTTVAFTPDGKFVAAGNKQGSIFVWDLATLQLRTILRYFPSQIAFDALAAPVECLVFSPDGLLISAALADEIVLWSYLTGNQMCPIKGTGSPVNGIAFSADSKRLAWTANDGKVRICPVSSMPLSPDGSISFPGSQGKVLDGHKQRVSAVSFSPDGSLLASAGEDLRFWDVTAGHQIGDPITRQTDHIPSIAFSPNGVLLASGSLDGTVVLWDVAKREQFGKTLVHDYYGVSAIAFTSNGDKLASTARDGTIALWDVASQRQLDRFEGHDGVALRIACSPSGNLLASAGSDGAVILWDVERHSSLRSETPAHGDRISSVAFSRDNQWVATGGWDGIINIVSRSRPPRTPVVLSHNQKITSFDFNSDGTMLASGTFGWLVLLWDVASGQKLGELSGHSGSVTCVRFSPVANIVAATSMDGSVILWDAANRERLDGALTKNGQPMLSLDFSPDGKLLAVGTQDSFILVWDLATRELVCEPLSAHTNSITSLAFHPQGNVLISGSRDETIRFWNIRNWKPRGLPRRAAALAVLDIAIAPKGDKLASCHADGSVSLWDSISGEHLAEFRIEYRTAVYCVRFSPDGDLLLAGMCAQPNPPYCSNGLAVYWDVSVKSWSDKACRMANRNLSEEEWKRYFGEQSYRKTCADLP